ncbi:MAG: ABC transporter ATP-binding protein [Sphingobacteriales bacterium]|nr:MAG: ABC transporter ATP-binding protein [Sphingobacteriales bacterium]
MPVVSIKNLNKTFKDFKAVSDLSFTVEEADVYGFLGQNGAGKSTTIRMLLTLIAPTSGTMELFGMNLRQHRREILQQVGAVIERPDLYKYLSGYENLALFGKMSGLRLTKNQLMDQLEVVGLADRAASKVKTYSQGMKQRLGIAVALVHNPRLIILDEPTNGLDPQGIADIRNLILHLSRQLKKTVIVSSHLLSEIEQVATRMLIIDKGKKMAEGSVTELFDPAKTIVKLSTDDVSAALSRLKDCKWESAITKTSGTSITFQVHKEQVALLNKELVALNIPVLGLQPGNSLEEYFLSLTGNNQHVATFTN